MGTDCIVERLFSGFLSGFFIRVGQKDYLNIIGGV